MPAAENTQDSAQTPVKKEPEKVLFSWEAPIRPFKRRNKDFWVTVIAMSVIVGLVLFLVEGFMPVILIISLVFLFYVLSTVEPENITYKLTNYGVAIGDRRTDWELATRFWITRRFDSKLLIIETLGLPGRMEYVVNDGDIAKIKEIAAKYLPEEEAPPSYLDKTANWFSKKLPQ